MVVRGLLDLLWPPRTNCLLCGGELDGGAEVACRACWDSMIFPADAHRCGNCARPMAEEKALCQECRASPAYGRVWALGLHHGALREAIHHLKFNGRDDLGPILGSMLARTIPERFDFLVPVPLHPSRLRDRGYNQATLVALGIAKVLGIPVADGTLVRVRSTGHQAKLDRKNRLQNLQGAFGLTAERPPWAGRTVLLVDDVLTTGTTASAVAAMIRGAGAERVDLAVLAVSTKPVDA